MPIVRKVFGPFAPERVGGALPELRWYFFGIRGDRSTAHWVLVFNPRTRKYSASSIPINDCLIGRSRKALWRENIDPTVKDETTHPDAWLDDTPVMEGKISQILKAKLPPAEIAKATAMAIQR